MAYRNEAQIISIRDRFSTFLLSFLFFTIIIFEFYFLKIDTTIVTIMSANIDIAKIIKKVLNNISRPTEEY
jgi:hypothetical protein